VYIFVMNIIKTGDLSQERQGWCYDDDFFMSYLACERCGWY